jgi:hypothetical protein
MHFYVGKIAMRTSAEATVAAATVVVAAPLCRMRVNLRIFSFSKRQGLAALKEECVFVFNLPGP